MKLKEINKELGTEYKSVKEIDWSYISCNISLSESFMEKHWEDLHKDYISKYQHLSEDFMDKHWEDLYKNYISVYQHLSESFMDKHWADLNKNYISINQSLTEEFMEKHWGDLHKDYISAYQHLSEDFMDKHWKDLDKYYIIRYQHLSEEFMDNHWTDLNKNYISKYQHLSESFIEKHNIELPDNNWLYKDINFKKEQIVNSGLYECHDDYFIAYKGIRRDRYSNYNFQYQYLPGETYESHADCSNNENSFGLSVWTEKEAKDYCKQLVVKCKVYYKDVARMVHNNGKIRCFKITILN